MNNRGLHHRYFPKAFIRRNLTQKAWLGVMLHAFLDQPLRMVTVVQIVSREYDFTSVSNATIVPYVCSSSLWQFPKFSLVPRATASSTLERRTNMNSKWRSDVHSPLFSIPERHKDDESFAIWISIFQTCLTRISSYSIHEISAAVEWQVACDHVIHRASNYAHPIRLFYVSKHRP